VASCNLARRGLHLPTLLFHALGSGTAPERPGAFPGHAFVSHFGFRFLIRVLGAGKGWRGVPGAAGPGEEVVGGAGCRGMVWGLCVGTS